MLNENAALLVISEKKTHATLKIDHPFMLCLTFTLFIFAIYYLSCIIMR